MKKLSEYKNEEALELLADLMEPVSLIFADAEVVKSFSTKNKLLVAKDIIKRHTHETFQILAILDGVPIEDYECSLFTLPLKLLDILNDAELQSFFKSQGLEMTHEESSGSAMENIEEQNE